MRTFIYPLLFLLSSAASAQTLEMMVEAQKAEREAAAAYRAKNFGDFLLRQQKANELRPNHPRLIYNLAVAQSKNGQASDAVGTLERLVMMGLVMPFDKDEDFVSIRDLAPFQKLLRLMEQSRKPVAKSTKVFSLADKELITEGVAFDPKTGTYFVGSIHKRKIIARLKDGTERDFSRESDGLWSVSGLKVDAKRRILWVSSTAFPQMHGFNKSDDGRSGIFKYDLKTGKLLRSFLLDSRDGKHALGDLTLDKSGNVYATDSISPNVYKIRVGSEKIELLISDKNFGSLQGLAFTKDEGSLYLADYSKGIFRYDVATRKLSQMKPSKNITLLGLDGLYYYKGALIGIQNGVSPQRVIKFSIDKSGESIDSFAVLEANHPDFLEPTLGVVIGNELHYVANSQWPNVDEKGALASDKLKNPVILKVKL